MLNCVTASVGRRQGLPAASVTVALVIVTGVASGCASYKYVGRWNQVGHTHSYVNRRHAIRLSFPNRSWQVFSSPRDEGYPSELAWKTPAKDNPAANYLTAVVLPLPVVFRLSIVPNPLGLSLERFERRIVHNWRKSSKIGVARPHIVVHNGRQMLMGETVVSTPGGTMRSVVLLVREPDRFVMFEFFAPVDQGIYNDKVRDFHAVVDSYRRLDGVVDTNPKEPVKESTEPGKTPPSSAPASQPTTQPASTTASSQPARRPASQSFDPSQWAQP
jgi:hypothetical protein